MITSPLLGNVRHIAIDNDSKSSAYTLIHISPSCWTIYDSFELFSKSKLPIGLDFQ